jgi:tRNA A37 methylthiotransferase MiaB
VFEEGGRAYRQRFIGQKTSVLWESVTQMNGQGWQMEGLTGNYLRVTASASQPLWNQISVVKLNNLTQDKVEGEIIPKA